MSRWSMPALSMATRASSRSVPEPFEQVEGEPGAGAQDVGQGLRAGALQQQRAPAADDERALDQLDHSRGVEPAQHLGLVVEPGRGGVVERHLEHPLGVRRRRASWS